MLLEITAPPAITLSSSLAFGHKRYHRSVQHIQVSHFAGLPVVDAVIAFGGQITTRQFGILARIPNFISIATFSKRALGQRNDDQYPDDDNQKETPVREVHLKLANK